MSLPSEKVNASAANDDLAILHTLFDFQDIGQELLNSSVSSTIWPPWLAPLQRLLKLASEYMVTLTLGRWRDGKVMKLLLLFANLIIWLASLISCNVALVTLALMFDTWKLISGEFILASQFSWQPVLLMADHSLSVAFLWGLLICSLVTGIGWILSVYACWSTVMKKSSFYFRLIPM